MKMNRRSIGWKRREIVLIIDNYATKTTKELAEMLPGRSEKAINRKIEVLRDEGRIGHRTEETKKRAYRQRERGRNKNKTKKRRLPKSDDYEPIE